MNNTIIDVHGHLSRDPEDLDAIVESGVISQAWLQDVSFYLDGGYKVEFAKQEEILKVADRYPGFFIPFGFLDFNQPVDEVDRLKERGFKGLKAIRPMKNYDDELYFPYYARAQELRMPILFHTGMISSSGSDDFTSGISTNSSRMRPAYLMGIAAEFPKLKIIAAHLGNTWGEETFQLLHSFPNAYADLSGGQNYAKLEWLHRYLHRKVGHKVLMGIDATYGRKCYHQDILMMAKFWELYFDVVLKSFDIYQHKDAIFRENAQKLTEDCFQ